MPAAPYSRCYRSDASAPNCRVRRPPCRGGVPSAGRRPHPRSKDAVGGHTMLPSTDVEHVLSNVHQTQPNVVLPWELNARISRGGTHMVKRSPRRAALQIMHVDTTNTTEHQHRHALRLREQRALQPRPLTARGPVGAEGCERRALRHDARACTIRLQARRYAHACTTHHHPS